MKIDRPTLLKAIALLLIVVLAFVVVRTTGLYEYLSKEKLQAFVTPFGVFAWLAYVVVFAVAIALLVPATPFTIAGAVIFGPWIGTVLNIIAITLGSVLAFYLARILGRDFARKAAGNILKKYDEKMEAHGFTTIFYLRMILLPLGPVNYAAGLTGVKLRDFILGTALGVIPATLIIMFFVSRLTDVHAWTDLLTWDVLLAVALFVGSFFIPKLVKKIFKREKLLEK